MTENTKTLLKHTILGLLGGGAFSAAYALNNVDKNKTSDQDSKANEITVPLSRRQFMKAVRQRNKGGSTEHKKKTPAIDGKDPQTMTPQELAALKKSILGSKTASCCSKSKPAKVTGPVAAERPVKHVAGAESTFLRDKKGRFSSDEKSEKSAGVIDGIANTIGGGLRRVFGDTLNDAGSTILSGAGIIGGLTTGMIATKMVADRILVNKKKKQVEEARRRYVDALANEVNDEDTPYYKKTAEDKSMLGSTLGVLGLAGLMTGSAAGIVMYRIMENRRRAVEKEKDKDLAKYPTDKTIKFRFPVDKTASHNFFG